MQNPQTIQLQLVRVQEHGAINTRLRGRGTDLILSILGPQVGQAVGLAFAVPRTQQERLCWPFSFLRSHFAKSPRETAEEGRPRNVLEWERGCYGNGLL